VQLSLVVLAAGVGRRFGGLKQLEAIGPSGGALMDYTVYDAHRAGFERVVLVVRKETEELIRKHVDSGFGRVFDVEYVNQEISAVPPGFDPPDDRSKPWGTGHAVLLTEGVIDGPFVAANADDYYGTRGFQQLARFFNQVTVDARIPEFAMVGYTVSQTVPHDTTVTRALCRADKDGYLQGLEEILALQRDHEGASWQDGNGETQRVGLDALVSMNLWGLTPSVFPELRKRFAAFLNRKPAPGDEFYLPVAIQEMVADNVGRVRVLPSSDSWCGLTSAEDRHEAQNHLKQLHAEGRYPERLWC
jgi:dTDP-glucose pyrophosphorylase